MSPDEWQVVLISLEILDGPSQLSPECRSLEALPQLVKLSAIHVFRLPFVAKKSDEIKGPVLTLLRHALHLFHKFTSQSTMSREPYSGPGRKLIVALDVGTTYSGISYSILDPGFPPEICGVHNFPGQVKAGGDVKIPSIMYYDQDGRMRAAGAEAEGDTIEAKVKEGNWVKAKWFKLHLQPERKAFATGSRSIIPPLPLNKTIVEVLSDFLQYLNQCAKQYIQEKHPGIGEDVLKEGSEIHYVLPHPNGWEGPERSLMRLAALKAGLISAEGPNQLSFITEGEASLNRCIEKGLMNDSVEKGDGVIIVDAGGGTLDISAYGLNFRSAGRFFEEIALPQCHLKGSISVTESAEKLKKSKYYEDIDTILEAFDKKAKCAFQDPAIPYDIQFGSVRDKDPDFQISAGKLRLDGKMISSFYEPAIRCIIDGVLEQWEGSRRSISSVFFVGGFSNNKYLFKCVKEQLQRYGLQASRPDTRLNKAVADGAIVGILDRPVRSRMARYAFGVDCSIIYNSMLEDHVERRSKCVEMLSGEKAIPNGFNLLLHKNAKVLDTEEYRCSYTRGYPNPRQLQVMEKEILCYHGGLPADGYKWMDNDPDSYQVVCTIKADLAGVPTLRCVNPRGRVYYKVMIDVILLFGDTELKAKIAWNENGKEKIRDAEVIYDIEGLSDVPTLVGTATESVSSPLSPRSPTSSDILSSPKSTIKSRVPKGKHRNAKQNSEQMKPPKEPESPKQPASDFTGSWDFSSSGWEF